MNAVMVILVNTAVLAITVYTLVQSGTNPRALVFAFFISTILRLVTVDALVRISKDLLWPSIKPWLDYLCSPAIKDQSSYAWKDGGTGKKTDLSGYLFIMAVIGLFTFTFVHVNKNRQLDFEWIIFINEMKWAFLYAFFYWSQDIVFKEIVINPDHTIDDNLGYNVLDVLILTFAMFICGGLIAFLQANKVDISSWLFIGPLLFIKHFRDVSAGLAASKH